MVLGSEGGHTVAEGVMEGTMPAEASPMVTMTMSHVLLGPGSAPQVMGPPTPETVLVPHNQIENQMAITDDPVNLDEFLTSEHGQRWFRNWQSGQVDSDMVAARWGKEVLELFIVTKTIEDDPGALDTQRKPEGEGSKEDNVKAAGDHGSRDKAVGLVEPETEMAGHTQADQEETQDVMDEENEDEQDEDVVLMQNPEIPKALKSI